MAKAGRKKIGKNRSVIFADEHYAYINWKTDHDLNFSAIVRRAIDEQIKKDGFKYNPRFEYSKCGTVKLREIIKKKQAKKKKHASRRTKRSPSKARK